MDDVFSLEHEVQLRWALNSLTHECDPCAAFFRTTRAIWIVHFVVPMPTKSWLLCNDCLVRWIAAGFGTNYDIGSHWEKI